MDQLRGLAILVMLVANLAGRTLEHPHPIWLRVLDSLAAPLFVFLAGMMVSYAWFERSRRMRHFVGRGLLLVAIGAGIDVGLWHVLPFTTVDILYLIGAAIPLVAWSCRMAAPDVALLGVLVIGISPGIRSFTGYAPYPTELALSALRPVPARTIADVSRHWFVDGYFPLFPWLSFALFGASFGRRRSKAPDGGIGRDRRMVLGFLTLGCIAWFVFPGPAYVREGYSEMFYPPVLGFCVTAMGFIRLAFFTVDHVFSMPRWLSALGRHSLLLYGVHLVIIEGARRMMGGELAWGGFLGVLVSAGALLWLTARAADWLAARLSGRNWLWRAILGSGERMIASDRS